MRIEFSTKGGFAPLPGFNTPVVIDTDDLAPDEAERLAALIAAAGFFDRPAQVGAHPPGGADMQHHIIAVDDGVRSHRVVMAAPVEDQALMELVRAVRAHAGPAHGRR